MKSPASFGYVQDKHGFTLIELLITISIIAILAAVGMIVYSSAQKNGRISRRIQDLNSMAKALEVYHTANGNYPCSKNSGCAAGTATTGSTSWGTRSVCAAWNPSGAINNTNVIPGGFVPQFMPVIPADPSMDPVNSNNCYIYSSDGNDYKVLDQNTTDMTSSDILKQPQLFDPAWYNGSYPCGKTATNPTDWAVYTPGAACW